MGARNAVPGAGMVLRPLPSPGIVGFLQQKCPPDCGFLYPPRAEKICEIFSGIVFAILNKLLCAS